MGVLGPSARRPPPPAAASGTTDGICPKAGVPGESQSVPDCLGFSWTAKNSRLSYRRFSMRNVLILILHLIVSMAKLPGPGGTRGLLARRHPYLSTEPCNNANAHMTRLVSSPLFDRYCLMKS